MSAINDLISQIQDESLRDRIQSEVNKMSKQKKFGLVFEEHLPECTPLYDVPVKRGSLAVLKGGDINNKYIVGSIVNGIAKCMNKVTEEVEEIPLENLVTVAEFGDPIYPYLKPIDSICNAPDSDLWHTLIEADNYHALQLLEYLLAGKDEYGTLILGEAEGAGAPFIPGTQWRISSHSAREQGASLLNKLFPDQRFSFPKSLYAVHDSIRFFVENKPNALIVDFFAGSGTTLHAVNLLNAEDGGHRRCIMVTNNEVSDAEAKEMTGKGLKPGDEEWEKLGIARYVTWPRTVCSIKGENIKGELLKGNYIGSDIPMSDGFKANAAFFKLGFLDKTSVALGRQFKEMLPTLWMKAGAHGPCPEIGENDDPDMLILPDNKMAILAEECSFPKFEAEVLKLSEIKTVFIVTDSESGYREMIKGFDGIETFQLYRDYLDNFRINTGRN